MHNHVTKFGMISSVLKVCVLAILFFFVLGTSFLEQVYAKDYPKNYKENGGQVGSGQVDNGQVDSGQVDGGEEYGSREYSLATGSLSAPKNWSEWGATLAVLNKSATVFIENERAEALVGKIDLKERDVTLVVLFWPKLLDKKVPFAKQYYICADLHNELLAKPSNAALSSWRSCVEMGYGRDPLPEIFISLLKWYQNLL